MYAQRTWLVIITCAVLSGCGSSSSESPTAPTPPPAPPPAPAPANLGAKLVELDQQSSPIVDTDPHSSLADLAPLAQLAEARIVGMGEGTHGTREFFQLKHKIFRYLVEEHDFRVFAIEADMAESVYIDRYVAGEDVDITEVMRDRMLFWTWHTEEVRDLIEWMRAENETRAPGDRLVYVGNDCQGPNWHPELLKSFFTDNAADLTDDVDALLAEFPSAGVPAFYDALGADGYHAMVDDIETLIELFDANEAAITASSSAFDFRLMRRIAENLGFIHELRYATATDAPGAAELREACMAKNTIWAEELVGEPVKIAMWAHNFHVAHDLPFRQGSMMRATLGQDYRTIGFTFAQGTATAIGDDGLATYTHSEPPRSGSITELFHAAEHSNFLLDMSELVPESELAQFLGQQRPVLVFGSLYNQNVNMYPAVVLSDQFDVVIHIDQATASRRLPR